MQVNGRLTSQRRRRGASAVEYIMVLALVVVPLAIMADALILWPGNGSQSSDAYQQKNQKTMIPAYEGRITSTIALPVG